MFKKTAVLMMAIVVAGCLINTNALAAKQFRIAWSHYTGWEPWEFARNSGIIDKWAQKYGIEIKLELVNDYIESINLEWVRLE